MSARNNNVAAAFVGFACGVFLSFFTMWLNDAGPGTARDYEVTVWENGVPRHFKAERVHLRGGVLTWEGGAAGPDAPFKVERKALK